MMKCHLKLVTKIKGQMNCESHCQCLTLKHTANVNGKIPMSVISIINVIFNVKTAFVALNKLKWEKIIVTGELKILFKGKRTWE